MAMINGEVEHISPMTVLEYLHQAGYNPERVVVEMNLNIIPRENFGDMMISDEDTEENLRFVGGG